MNIFIGMETSGTLRRRFQAKGHWVVSVDLLPAEDGAATHPRLLKASGGHCVGDVFAYFEMFRAKGVKFDLAIFHPDCTHLTNSAAWAFRDPDFRRYPEGGYHQKVRPGTLVGKDRVAARKQALEVVQRILKLPVRKKAIENPIGTITWVRPFSQLIQPWQFGDDASKETGLILEYLPRLPIDPKKEIKPRVVCQKCLTHYVSGAVPVQCKECGLPSRYMAPRWGNQTDTGQNNLSPDEERWVERSRTYPGIADAMVETWG